MKSWLLLLFAWIAAIAATPAYAFPTAESKGDAGYFSYGQRDNKTPAQNNRCDLRKELLSSWFGALRELTPDHSVGRKKTRPIALPLIGWMLFDPSSLSGAI